MNATMSDTQLRVAQRSIVAVAVVVGTAGTVLLTARGQVTVGEYSAGYLSMLALGAVVWIGTATQPSNRLLWVLTLWVSAISLFPVALLAELRLDPDVPTPIDIETVVPADLDPGIARIEGLVGAVGTLAMFALLTFGFLLFPDGRLPSRRWRWVAVLLALGLAAFSVINYVILDPSSTVVPVDHPLFHLTAPFALGAPPVSIAGLIVKYRRSDRTERDRIRWIFLAGIVAFPTMLAGMVFGVSPLIDLGLLIIAAGYGIAIVRYRLFDVNVVLSRTLMFGALAAFIGVVYVGVVVGVGSLVGNAEDPNPVLAITATALVATVFQPARRRAQRFADRVVYGRRATPYQVLADFSRRVAATGSESLLDVAARSLVEGTTAERCTIELLIDGDSVEAAAWPIADDTFVDERPDGNQRPDVNRFPIAEGTSTLGVLTLRLPAGETLSGDEHRLVEQVASGMGLALHNQALTERLAARVDELRESRRRLVTVQDNTRRRLERDLHDGAQQQLVALKVKLGLCQTIARQTADPQLTEQLDELASNADRAVEALRAFARSVYPAVLESDGLEAAIGAQLRRIQQPINLTTTGLSRYERDIEATVYFCILEALAVTDVATIDITQSNGDLTFQIGSGGRPAGSAANGVHGDLERVLDRVDALAGTVTVTADPGDGAARLVGTIPISARSRP